jgi:hypothetical protein
VWVGWGGWGERVVVSLPAGKVSAMHREGGWGERAVGMVSRVTGARSDVAKFGQIGDI